ncbi:glycoside hydrolase family 104 protein [Robbsia sp. Bb-Pol-6]|uniref:Glycoside hydrolase family 104 protein n=1 Tax=Robbsia betulipollinis TaxID=2981849 RepID=A0ABT3ZT47_9BURK|nr:glycoside hydrolase family 104 protein [Robbsia betulipollinis]MCY0389728.1 glycoside hydrolase family 104 protein [Robbsia betulipollinis]
MNPNRRAFLLMIQRAEGTSTSPATRAVGYDVIVTGIDGRPEVFDDFSRHPFAGGRPAKQVRPGLWSTASGAYQQKLANWLHYAPLLALPDFGPASQDAIALRQIAEFGALAFVDAGRIETAIGKVAPLWASLPGAGYRQPEHSLAQVCAFYEQAGGVVGA